jgi:monoamine oxidase
LTGLVAVTRDTSNPKIGAWRLQSFLVGAPNRAWAKLSKEERRKGVEGHIKAVYGPLIKGEIPEATGYEEMIWPHELWSQGCPVNSFPPGLMTEVLKDEDALRGAFRNIHFVGTETAYEWKGYMDGAVRSGERGADEVLRKLGKAKL